MDSLKFEQIDSRHSTIKAAYTATCKWFLQSPEYLAWIDLAKLDEHHGFLWLSGKPGAGKSTIMKFAYTRAKRAPVATKAVVSFFFNARGDVLEKSITGLYRSLLLQLLEKFPDLQTVCEDTNLVKRNGICPSLEATQVLFRNAISMLGKRSLTCFIDALDECDELQVLDMVQYFEVLGQQAAEEKIELRICFSSRHYPYISIRHGLRLTLEDQKGHGEDVERYIQGNLRADPGPLVTEVQAQILQKAAGVFMWVVLVVDILNKEFSRGRMFAVQKRLAEIPERLSDLFKDILKRDNENMEDLLLCLQWILYAKRPLIREEFYFAVSIGLLGEDELTPNYLTSYIPSDVMDRFVVSSSKGLAEVTKSNQHAVQFIHESVRDFLIKDNGFQELWPQVGHDFDKLSHDKLKKCCHKYLKLGTTHLLARGALLKENERVNNSRETVSKQAPFLQYATQHVLYHANIAASNILQNDFLAEFKLQDWIILNNLFEKFKVRRHTANASLFYILAERGFSALIQTELRHDWRCYTLGERYRYPMFAALINGHGDTIQALEEAAPSAGKSGAFRRLEDMQYDSIYKNAELFMWAVSNGYKPVVEWLIERGADVNAKNFDGVSALFKATDRGHINIAKLLVERGADVNCKGIGIFGLYISALINAMQKGRNTMAEILIEKGADINAKDNSDQTPLLIAIKQENKDIIRLLLEKSVDINALTKNGQTPLLYGLEQGSHDDIIQLLIKQNGDINVEDNYGRIPLLYAMQKQRHNNIIQLLIKNGADVNVKDRRCRTPLFLAIHKMDYNIARLLIEEGADVNVKDIYGDTPLLFASRMNANKVTQLLIEKGADISVVDDKGRTALNVSFERGNTFITEFLIERGADTSLIGLGRTTSQERLDMH